MSHKDAPPVEELLEHTGFVRSLARGALGKDDLSEDIVQDAWVAAIERGPRDRRAARSWLYRVVHNRVASLRRRDATRQRYLERPAKQQSVPAPAEILQREEARRRLVAALLTLDEIYREPLVLKYYEDLKPREIAKRLDVPVETVRTRLRRGIDRLREGLDTDYGDRRAWVLAAVPLTWLPKAPGGPLVPPVVSSLTAKQLAIIAGAVLAIGVTTFAVLSSPSTGEHATATDAGSDIPTGPPELQTKALPAVRTKAMPIERRDTAQRDCLVTVVDYASEPVANAKVVLAKHKDDWDYDGIWRTTDASGRVRLPRLATPDAADEIRTVAYVLRIARPPAREDLRAVRIDEWRPGDATIRMPRGFVVSGVVVDAANRPVPGAWVELRSDIHERRVESDEQGRFYAAGLPDGRWRAEVSLHRIGPSAHRARHILDSGTRGARLEVALVGERHLVQLPDYDPGRRDHKRKSLRVTEYDPTTGKDTGVSEHPVSPDGTVSLYGLRDDRAYALWWGPDDRDRYLYVPRLQMGLGATRERLSQGVAIEVEVTLPDGFEGWPQIEATARGIVLRAVWDTIATARTYHETQDPRRKHFVIWGVPDGEYVLRASGRDWNDVEVSGEMRVRAGQPSVHMELKRR